jgi:hypothetical protein
MITVIVQDIFPYFCQAVPCSSTRAPPPLANCVVSKGDSSVYQQLLASKSNDDSDAVDPQFSSTYHPPVSLPIAINKTVEGDTVSMNSSADEKFYSPPSTPDDTTRQESKSGEIMNDVFFSPKTDTLAQVLTKPSFLLDFSRRFLYRQFFPYLVFVTCTPYHTKTIFWLGLSWHTTRA